MKRFIMLLLLVSVVVGSVGCAKKGDELTLEEYKAISENYKILLDENTAKLENLKGILYTYDPELPELEDIEESMVVPDGTKSFLSVNSKLILNNPLDDDGYERIANQSKIYLNDSVFITPTDNWKFSLVGDSLKMEHSSKIYGEVKSYAYVGEFNSIDCYAGILVPYLDKLGVKKHDTTTLFVGDVRSGYSTTSNIKVVDIDEEEVEEETTVEEKEDTVEKKEDAVEKKEKTAKKKVPKKKNYSLVFGVLINEDKILMYQFTYEKSGGDSALREIVNSTIKTMSVNGGYLGME